VPLEVTVFIESKGGFMATTRGRAIGIDLGTTNSVAAVVEAVPRVLPSNPEGKDMTRSCVGIKKRKNSATTETLVGDVAYDNMPVSSRDTIISVKRLMGRSVNDQEVKKIQAWAPYTIVPPTDGTRDSIRVIMGEQEYSPVEISSMILKKLKADAEFRLGEEVTHAVITVPAYFTQIQCAATRNAAELAGLKVIRLLDEPSAAAVAYGIGSPSSDDPKTILVYDLGGGTFDVSIMVYGGATFATLDIEGDMWLGGDNFDQLIMNEVVTFINQEYGINPVNNARFMAELRKQAQITKERLSSARSAELLISGMLQDNDGDLIDIEYEMTQDQYATLVSPLIANSISIVKQALGKAHLSPDEIDVVLMAGNASNSPLVQRAVESLFGPDKIKRNIHAKYCVAFGAALCALRNDRIYCVAPDTADPKKMCNHPNDENAILCSKCGASLETLDDELVYERIDVRTPASVDYGIQTIGDVFSVFIHKNDPVPTEKENRITQRFHTNMPNQRMISVPIYGGMNHERASANEKQGQAFAILPPGLPASTDILLTLWMDGDRVFKLSAELGDGTPLKPWIMDGDGKDGSHALEIIEELEMKIAQKPGMSPQQKQEVDAEREKAFECMRNRDFQGAEQDARKAIEVADVEGTIVGPPLRTKAERLVNYTSLVLGEYGWALDPGKAYSLQNLVEETKTAMQSGDKVALERAVVRLDEATDDIPDFVQHLLGVKGAIIERIKPTLPTKAQEYLRELADIEQLLKRGDIQQGITKFEDLMQKVAKTFEEIGGGNTQVCWGEDCKTVMPMGQRICPKCGRDQLIPRGGQTAKSSGCFSVL